jgi:hypothetical protein
MKIFSKKYIHGPKSETTEISKIFMDFTHNKKVEIVSFIKARIRIRSQTPGSDQKGPDP